MKLIGSGRMAALATFMVALVQSAWGFIVSGGYTNPSNTSSPPLTKFSP